MRYLELAAILVSTTRANYRAPVVKEFVLAANTEEISRCNHRSNSWC